MRSYIRMLVICGSTVMMAAPVAARAETAPTSATPSEPTGGNAQPGAKAPSESHPTSFPRLVEHALQSLNLRPDQQAKVQAIEAKLDECAKSVREAKSKFMDALASQIESGSVSKDSLESEEENVVTAVKKAAPVVRESLEELHEVLDQQQREDFVSTVHKEMKKHEHGTKADAVVKELTKALDLSEGQQEQIKKAFSSSDLPVLTKVEHARVKLVLAAFPGKHFAMDELVPKGAAGALADEALDSAIAVACEVSEVLSNTQRKQLAECIRNEASRSSQEKGESGPAENPGKSGESAPSSEHSPDSGEYRDGPASYVEEDINMM